jgi:predicted 3-demethylubiquinone-9 3-methyltransferase (glyoxalase superfamily)
MSASSPRVTPFLWFERAAEEAAAFYVGVFPNSRIDAVVRYPEGTPGVAGTVMTVAFRLDGQVFTALNGGPHYRFSPAISFVIDCADQAEIDHYWDALSTGGRVQQCGWLDDRYGITWQVVPRALPQMLQDPDPARAQRVAQAMMTMVKFDLAALQRAQRGD